jgi:hypothetical protein
MTNRAEPTRSPLSVLSLLAATFILAFTVYQAPHTVHHLFESTAEEPPECSFASQAERTQTIAAAVLEVTHVQALGVGLLTVDSPFLPSLALTPSRARGPPPRIA